MINNFINLIRALSNEDYDRFVIFLNNIRDYPYFDSLYDMDQFYKDVIYFGELFKTIDLNGNVKGGMVK